MESHAAQRRLRCFPTAARLRTPLAVLQKPAGALGTAGGEPGGQRRLFAAAQLGAKPDGLERLGQLALDAGHAVPRVGEEGAQLGRPRRVAEGAHAAYHARKAVLGQLALELDESLLEEGPRRLARRALLEEHA